MRHSTLHQLKVFETVARHRSFTRAAEELFLTQPTVSLQIKQLTKAAGAPLFEQVGKRLYLTEAGRELFSTCSEIFEQITQFETKMAAIKGMQQGRLKVAASTTTQYLIPRLLGPFHQQYPGIDISLDVANHDDLVERLSNNLADLYIMSHPPEQGNFSCQPFLENPLVVLAPLNHPLAKQRQIPIDRLNGEAFIMREPGSGTRKTVQQLFQTHDIQVKVRLELGNDEAIKQAIAVGFGISILSRHLLMAETVNSQLSILDVEGFPLQQQWYVVYPLGKQLSVIAETFQQFLLTLPPVLPNLSALDRTIPMLPKAS